MSCAPFLSLHACASLSTTAACSEVCLFNCALQGSRSLHTRASTAPLLPALSCWRLSQQVQAARADLLLCCRQGPCVRDHVRPRKQAVGAAAQHLPQSAARPPRLGHVLGCALCPRARKQQICLQHAASVTTKLHRSACVDRAVFGWLQLAATVSALCADSLPTATRHCSLP